MLQVLLLSLLLAQFSFSDAFLMGGNKMSVKKMTTLHAKITPNKGREEVRIFGDIYT